MNELLEVSELKNILGYKDMRSIRQWCRKNNVPIIVLGRKRYVHRQSIEAIIERQLPGHAITGGSHQNALDAIGKGNKPLVGKAIKPKATASKRNLQSRYKKQHSKAAYDLLNAVHSTK